MEFRQLETFVEVAKLKSFSKAADKLYITQPTVSNHIQNLERELGTLLINRMGKKISLTEAGNLLYKYALNITNSFEMARFELEAFQGKIQGHLDIMSSSVPRKYLLPSLIKSFLDLFPDVTFNISNSDTKEVIQNILDGETDFGLVGAKIDSPNLKYVNIMEDNLVLVAPKNCTIDLIDESTISLDSIMNKKFILREEGSGTRDLIFKALKASNIHKSNLNIVALVKDSETIKELIYQGVGFSFLSLKDVSDDIKLGKYKVYNVRELDLKRNFYFVYHKNRQLSPLGNAFKNHAIESTKALNSN